MTLARAHWSRIRPACLAASVVVVGACSAAIPGAPESSSSSATPASDSVAVSPLRGGESDEALKAAGVVGAITKVGLPAPNPLDTTAQDCPLIGCTQSIVTDTLAVKSFATSGEAERFAVPRGLFQVATFVVSFAPVVDERDRARYRAQLATILD